MGDWHWHQWINPGHGLGPQWRKLNRVTACVGWAVHGVVFEFEDGQRSGIVLHNNGTPMALNDDDIASRGGTHRWTSIEPGDYIVRVSGNQLRPGTPPYLCHTLRLHFASGRAISLGSSHEPWKGAEFSDTVPRLYLVNSLAFGVRRGYRGFRSPHLPLSGYQAFRGTEVTSIHLPISMADAGHLPQSCKDKLELLLLIAQKNSERSVGIGADAMWSVLSFLTGYDLLD